MPKAFPEEFRRDMIAIVPPRLRAPGLMVTKSMNTRLPLRTVEQIVFVGAALVVGLGGIQ